MNSFSEQLKRRMRILDEMNYRHIDDVLPLICMDISELEKFQKLLKEQDCYDFADNPIYYFSEKLNVSYQIKINN